MPIYETHPPPTASPDAAATDAPSGDPVLERVVAPVVETMGFELVHIEWSPSKRHRIVRVYLDHASGVTLEDCARMSRVIENALDAAETSPDASDVRAALTGSYTLEVSSPGLERPLVKRSHFERFIGQRAVVRTDVPLDAEGSQRTFHGHILATQQDPAAPDDERRGTIVLRDLTGTTTHRIPLTCVRRANLVYEG